MYIDEGTNKLLKIKSKVIKTTMKYKTQKNV
jgi:hypothetical protein